MSTTSSDDRPGQSSDQLAALAARLVGEVVGGSATMVRPLIGGLIARVFRVESRDGPVVVRLQPGLPDAFAADRGVMRLLAGSDVPVPELLGAGFDDGAGWTITRFVDGTPADQLDAGTFAAVFPAMLDVLARVHHVDAGDTTGFGILDPDGNGRSTSWRQSHLDGFDPATPGFWHDWRRRLADSPMDWTTFDEWLGYLPGLLATCPEPRVLVHGDYGYNNVLIGDGGVSAVLDWSIARWGDPLWDVAWLSSYGMPIDQLPALDAAFVHLRDDEADYRHRIDTYRVVIYLDTMRNMARLDDAAGMEWLRGLLDRLRPGLGL